MSGDQVSVERLIEVLSVMIAPLQAAGHGQRNIPRCGACAAVNAAHSLIAALDGMVLVPREPTEARLRAGSRASLSTAVLMDDTRYACEAAIYRAMITTAERSDNG